MHHAIPSQHWKKKSKNKIKMYKSQKLASFYIYLYASNVWYKSPIILFSIVLIFTILILLHILDKSFRRWKISSYVKQNDGEKNSFIQELSQESEELQNERRQLRVCSDR